MNLLKTIEKLPEGSNISIGAASGWIFFGTREEYLENYVVFDDEYGEERKVLTKHCHNRADGYLGCQVDVGFDASTGEWIILE